MELTIEQALQQAVEAHKVGKLQDAEALYRAILQAQPKHPDANHNLGVMAVSLNKTEAALPLFKIALEANPNQGQFWLSYIDGLIKEKQFDNARNVLKQGKKRGLTGEKIDALEAQLTPIALVEKSESILPKQPSSFTKQHKTVSAKNKKSSSNLTNPNQVRSPSQVEVNALLEHYQKGRLDLAENLAKTITHKYPDHQFGWKVLGAVFGQTGRLQESLIANQRAVAISPNDAQAHCNLGATLKELGRLEDAEATYRKAIAIKPEYAEAHSNLGAALQELGRLKDAEASYNKAITIKPEYAEAHSNLGATLKELGRLEDAEASYKKAIAIKPEFAEAHSNLGITLQELGRLEDAEASYKKAIAIKPEYAKAYSNLGILLMQTGDLEGSRNMHERAIKLDAENWNIHYNYSAYLYETGHTDAAEDSLKCARSNAPKNKIKLCELSLKAVSAHKSSFKTKVDETFQLDTNLKCRLRSDPLILSRHVEKELIAYLYQISSIVLNETKNTDARYGNGRCSIDFELFNDKSKVIKVVAQDLIKICRDAVNSEVHIYDSFFNIYSAGAGTTIHHHITIGDRYFDLKKRKYSLVYYLDVGDQSGLEPGVLRLFNPDQGIMPNNGMIVIINAIKKHHALYDGKTDRIMIGVNFYSI